MSEIIYRPVRFSSEEYAKEYMLKFEIGINTTTNELCMKDGNENIISLTSDETKIEILQELLGLSLKHWRNTYK